MRSALVGTLLVAFVCICLLPAALWAQEDPNAPWDPNTHLAASPRICALSAEYYTPEYGDGSWIAFDRQIKLSGKIAVTDPNGLIGLSMYPTDIRAWDAIGTPLDPVSDEENTPIYVPLEYAATIWLPEMTWTVDPVPYDFSLDLRLDADGAFPASLSRVEWSMNVLLSDRFENVDLPFAPTDDWVEIAPGLEVRIEETTVTDGRYECRMQTRLDPNRVVHPDYRPRTSATRRDEGYRWSDQTAPEAVVIAIEVLDAEGTSVHYQGSGTVGSRMISLSADDPTVITRLEIGNCDTCGQAALLSHTIAYAPYEQKVRLTMEDVTLPPQ